MSHSGIKISYIIFFIIIILAILWETTEHFKIVSVKGFNDNYHSVRNDFNNTNEAANLMARLKENMNELIDYLNIHHNNNKGVKNLNKRFDLDSMMEAEHQASSTSFTINKGEEVQLCLREKNEEKILHDINTMMFVLLHEMAHIMSITIGHNKEFKDNFQFLLNIATKINLYKKINYQLNPQSYCGIKINSTPLKF
jgi:hypothetical protein